MLVRLWRGLHAGVRAAAYEIAELFGEHDYDRYLAAWKISHPHAAPDSSHRPLSAAEFFDLRLEKKYGGQFSRC